MDILTIDFESAYSPQYSLSKMTTQEYIDDPRFEVIGVAVKKNDEPTQWFSGTHEETKHWLYQFPWERSIAVIHNANFDASILAWRFGIRPKLVACTLSEGRALHGTSVGGSLKVLAEYYGIGQKGDEVLHAIGKWRKDFTPEELERYAEYCKLDVDLTYELFKCMAPKFNAVEMHLISMTVKMHSEPMLQLDRKVLEQHLQDVQDNKERLLTESGLTSEDLRSDQRLAEVLKSMGVEPPTKVSARTGKEAYAFAKSDEAFKEMLEHEDPRVQAIVAARLGVKTTIEESRTERFIAIHDAGGALPVPLQYYKAMTGRWAGSEKINLQNLPRTSALKKAIIAPLGHVIVGADLSNIELRVGLAFAGQEDKLKMLGEGLDLYKDFVAPIFNVAYDEVNDHQRFIGKTCIAEGTLVLCDTGWKPIETVSVDDRVWDGKEWVCHQGLITNGLKETLQIYGSWLTPDHLVLSGTRWLESQSVVSDASILCQALDTGAENLPLQAIYKASKVALPLLLFNVIVGAVNTQWTNITSKISKALAVRAVLDLLERKNDTGCTPKLCLMMGTELDYSIESPRQLQDVRTRIAPLMSTTAPEELAFFKNGVMTAPRFLDTFKLYRDGIIQRWKWIGSTLMVTMNQAISGLSLAPIMPKTKGEYPTLKRRLPVYDLFSCGPRHRFTILTKKGPLIVHNCQLSLIYGTGAKKLRAAIKADPRYGTDIGEELAQSIVNTYRSEYSNVKAAWYNAGRALEAVWLDSEDEIGLGPLKLRVRGSRGIELPSGLFMQYPELTKSTNEEGREQWTYKQRKGRSWETVYIHPAKCYQNTIQALARCIMGEAMVRINKRYRVGLTIHDACYTVVPVDEAEEALKFIIRELKKPPVWMPDIPLDAEGGIGENLAFKMGKVKV